MDAYAFRRIYCLTEAIRQGPLSCQCEDLPHLSEARGRAVDNGDPYSVRGSRGSVPLGRPRRREGPNCLAVVAMFYTRVGKGLIDRALAGAGLIVLAPVLSGLALVVRRRLGSPVLFRQVRPGLHGEPFEMVKFRTMTDARGPDGALLPDAERLTPFGQFLRSTSLDELPELWNVVQGDMSIVGPRPLLMRYLDRYTPEQARRHEVRPGITGLAQVSGRNAISWEDKFALDVRYVDHASLWLDLEILARTVLKVVRRDDIAADAHVTMPEFMGTVSVDKAAHR